MHKDKRRERKCSDCGHPYEVRSTIPPPDKPVCPPCRQAKARAREKYQGWGWPLFKYTIVRHFRRTTRAIRRG